jgi:hypothetical protein
MSKPRSCALVFLLLAASGAIRAGEPTCVWWEGEAYQATNSTTPLAAVPGNSRPEQRAKLSGGRWMTPHKPAGGGACTVTYRVKVPADRTYDFYVRKFWKHGPFKWRFDDRPWRECGRNIALLDNTFLQKHWGANWVALGRVQLAAGGHTLHVEMIENKGCFDCWLLIDGPFIPRGKLRPSQKAGLAHPGFFAWEPDADPLAGDCPIDMSGLNKPITGFARREGNGFVDASGAPLRFWMVQGSCLLSMERRMVDYWARRLAKYGVNLNRLQFSGLFEAYVRDDTASFDRQLDALHYTVTALKKRGIYCYFGHLYWQTHVKLNQKVAGPGYGSGRTPLELLFFDPKFQAYYRKFVSAVMSRRSPYSGIPLSRDPAVAFVEIQNESSLFFWTFKPARMVPRTLRLMEEAFGAWARRKHGSLEKALAAWGRAKAPKAPSLDRPEAGRLGLYGAGFLTGAGWARSQRNPARASDQLQFMVEAQKGFYEKMIGDLRKEPGLRCMITCSNWKTADPRTLGVLERYTYTPGDAICRNVYFGVSYKPRPRRFYAVDPGDTFLGRSALLPPARPSPLTVGHVCDHPYMITENTWTRPNRYRAEWPWLVATYARMMGVDGWNFFALDPAMWQTPMSVWELNSPCVLGQFPAAALVFRRGDVREAPCAVTDRLNLRDLYGFKGPYLHELSGADDLWVSRIGRREAGADARAGQPEPMAFLVGKVNRVPSGEKSRLTTVDFSRYIDARARKVRSLTGQLELDYGKGIATVDAPRVQGAAGFLRRGGTIRLQDIDIACRSDYCSILVVSLDGRPLKQSRKILIQAATEDLPYGFKTRARGEYREITDLGGYPLNVRLIRAAITFKGRKSGKARATVLDGNGYRTDRAARTERAGGGLRVVLPENSLYTLLE